MFLDIRAVRVRNFRSYTAEQTLQFSGKPGFYYMGGENRRRPDLGSNGSGKSSLWDSVLWCLTGRTSRGIRGASVANWKAKGACQVEVDLAHPEDRSILTVQRRANPNSLIIGNPAMGWRPVSQEELEQRLGFNYEVLTSTILMSQFGRYFFDLTPTEKLSLFSGLFDLEFWLGCSDRAKVEVKDAEGRLVDANNIIAKASGALEALKGRLSEARKQSGTWQEAHDYQRQAAKEEVRKTTDAADAAHRSRRTARNAYRAAEAKLQERQQELIVLDDHLREVTPGVQAAEKDSEHAQREVETWQKEASRVRKMRGECPTCYGDVDEVHVGRVCATLEHKRIRPANERLEIAKAAERKAVRNYNRILDDHKAAEKAVVRAEKLVESTKDLYVAATERARAAYRALEVAEGKSRAAKQAENPHQSTIDQCREEIQGHEKQVADATREKNDAAKALDRSTYWVTGFKDLRLWTIERALVDFEICVNNSLLDLGLSDWKVTFDVERPTQSGGVSKGFSVFIESPDSGGPVPWESWCGGETQRLRVAGAIGLSDLVRSRRGFASTLEVWDEPTQHLSPPGVEDLLRFLQSRAKEQGKQIWLVDHVAMQGGDFAGSVRVIHEASGSRIEAGNGTRRRRVALEA